MTEPVTQHPVEAAPEAPPVDPAWARLIAAENAIQEQARQMADIQTSIGNVLMIVSWFSELRKEENEQRSSESGVRSRVRPSEPPDFDGTREKGQAFLNGCLFYFVQSDITSQTSRLVSTGL